MQKTRKPQPTAPPQPPAQPPHPLYPMPYIIVQQYFRIQIMLGNYSNTKLRQKYHKRQMERIFRICCNFIWYEMRIFQRGVEKMNTLVDVRESFFKNRVTGLMSRDSVMRMLSKGNKKDKPMGKKSQVLVTESSPVRKIDNKQELQLKQKKKQMQMRIKYAVEDHNTEQVKKLTSQHRVKQQFLTSKIDQIVDSHEQKLLKRIKQRKLRTLTAKSRPEHPTQNQLNEIQANSNANITFSQIKQLMEKKRDEEQFGNIIQQLQDQQPKKMEENLRRIGRNRRVKSLSPRKLTYGTWRAKKGDKNKSKQKQKQREKGQEKKQLDIQDLIKEEEVEVDVFKEIEEQANSPQRRRVSMDLRLLNVNIKQKMQEYQFK